MTETAEQIAIRFLTDFLQGDETLARKWRSEADARYNLTLQLCVSYAAEIERLRAALDRIGAMFYINQYGAIILKHGSLNEDVLNAVNAALEQTPGKGK